MARVSKKRLFFNQPPTIRLGICSITRYLPARQLRNYGLLCATPYTLKTWGEQEIYKLKVLRPKLQQLLEYSESLSKGLKTSNSPSKSMSAMDASRAELQEQMEKTNALMATIRADKNRLLEERTQQVRLWSERQRNLEDQVKP